MKSNLTNDNEHEEKLLALAEECFQGQKFEAILKPFESFLLESPKRVRIVLKLAEAYFALKSYRESLRLISIAQILDEEKVSIYALRIAVFLELNELEKVESEFLHFKTKFSVPNDSHYSILALNAINTRMICYAYMRNGQREHQLALVICEFIGSRFDFSSGSEASLMAQQYAMTEQPEKGLDLIAEFLPIFEKDHMLFYARAKCYENLNNFKLALADFKMAVKLGITPIDGDIERVTNLLKDAP